MFTDNLNPMMEQGIIAGKCTLDWHAISERMRNADDPGIAQFVYPGGSHEQHHYAMVGDISMGLKEVRNNNVMEGEPNELGTTSLAGEETVNKFTSMRAFEDQYYFQGFVASEQGLNDELQLGSGDDPSQGYAIVRAGAKSVANGPEMVFPGQYMYVSAPAVKSGKHHWELRPFDYTDFDLEIIGALDAITLPKSDGGISDMSFNDFFRNDGIKEAFSYTCAQEEAAGLKYGTLGAVLVGVQYLIDNGLLRSGEDFSREQNKDLGRAETVKIANALGLWSKDANEQAPMRGLLEKIFAGVRPDPNKERDGIATGANFKTASQLLSTPNSDNDSAINYAKLRLSLSLFTHAHLVGSWYHKTSKIVGRALNNAGPNETLHGLWGHFVL